MTLAVHRLDAARMADFWALHAHVGHGCFCAAWWVPSWDGWGERSADDNRAVRAALAARGEHDGYLLYDGDAPVGWCQVGVRDRLAKLGAQLQLQPDAATWAVSCVLVAPGRRRQGLARRLLEGVLADLRARGVASVEAYPKQGADLDEADLWNGPAALWQALGFQHVKQVGPRAVMQLRLR